MRREAIMKKVAIGLCVLYFMQYGSLLYAGVLLQGGTPIQLELTETISSENATVGQKVPMKVTHDVMVRDDILIRGGTRATAEVSSVETKGSLGKAGSLGIQVKSVRAVDGKIVPLTASRVIKGQSKQTEAIVITLLLCIFGLFVKGEEATMQAGNVIEATTLTNVEIEVAPAEEMAPEEEAIPEEIIPDEEMPIEEIEEEE